ncbi:malonyl-ACP O-methyltransferase BioC [Microaerobacter geothermalis]|uniref:malonyl-ACP O-methyltransferase BioC n=1 Tax=Microaerobacter geothermalis TaxID=674972 RepID=UPI001F2E9B76|nr:malonyl-ACP O-methyltransferase BioC [Microaerobacter geothermalis]MCF6094285.1 malonyl-ACP O-methyltransferase BioC [Microaerobacter geothermalis]
MIDKQLLKKRFSTNAKSYDRYANVQKKMALELIKLLQLNKGIRKTEMNILEVGCGTGYLTEQLCHLYPKANITAVDLAPGMIEMARQRVVKNVTFCCGDIEEMIMSDPYDMIISNATFQWLNHLESTLRRLFTWLTNDGGIYFSTFGNQTFTELHTSFQLAKQRLQIDSTGSLGQSFYSLDDLNGLCQRSLHDSNWDSTFTIQAYEKMEYEYFPTMQDFFTSIRRIGANNSNQGEYCLRPTLFKEMIRIYETNFRKESQMQVSYHCLFLSIIKT